MSVNGEERRGPGGSGEGGGSTNVGKAGAFETFELDAVDSAVLDWVQDLYAKSDPVPQDLLARVDFAMDLLGPDDEVALLQDDLFEAVGVRSTNASASAEHSRTVTFDSESLTIVIQASPSGEAVRVDGWLAPPAVHRVRLRAGERELQTESDELGGFVLTQVPHGLVQVIVEVGDAAEVGTADPPQSRTVVTTAVLL